MTRCDGAQTKAAPQHTITDQRRLRPALLPVSSAIRDSRQVAFFIEGPGFSVSSPNPVRADGLSEKQPVGREGYQPTSCFSPHRVDFVAQQARNLGLAVGVQGRYEPFSAKQATRNCVHDAASASHASPFWFWRARLKRAPYGKRSGDRSRGGPDRDTGRVAGAGGERRQQ